MNSHITMKTTHNVKKNRNKHQPIRNTKFNFKIRRTSIYIISNIYDFLKVNIIYIYINECSQNLPFTNMCKYIYIYIYIYTIITFLLSPIFE